MSTAARNFASHAVAIVAGILAFSTVALGQVESVTLSEPSTVSVADLFKQADFVAIVKVLSGDSEHYAITVYKAEVLKAFKGARSTERLYFGPFVNYGVGSEYLAFLRQTKDELRVTRNTGDPGLNYGKIGTSYLVMYDGYSVMPVRYACVFEEKGSNEPCDYGVKVNTYQVRLPKSIKTYPTESADADVSDMKWVKRSALISLLEGLPAAK